MTFELLRLYSLDKNYVNLDGLRIGGWGEDAAVTYEMSSEIFEHTVGADGMVTASKLSDKRMIATLTVMETSPSYARLGGLQKKQMEIFDRLGVLKPMIYSHADAINGDLVKSPQTLFLTWPAPDKSKTAGEREFKLLLPYSAASIVHGAKLIL